jgi:phosphoribosylformylglycinamidine (FGAM) synthase-like enzyme
LQGLLADLAARRLVAAAHDLSDGGLAVALVEATLAAGVGVAVDLPPLLTGGPGSAPDLPPRLAGGPGSAPDRPRALAALVSESSSRVLLGVPREAAGELATLAATAGVPATRLGVTGGDRLVVGGVVDLPLSQLGDAYESALPRALGDSP